MRAIRWCRWPALLALPVLAGSLALPAAGQTSADKVTLRVVKFDDLIRTLNGLKGKVVVMDVWADT
ncbi:MAG TPA: hypothetical protein VNK04_21750 [Gemmataceae bacterium]|nr:hypothetical protein [Gemmataceae bacterium]